MSRIGKRPINIPDKVTVTLDGQQVSVKGPKGQLDRILPPEVTIEQDNNTLMVKRRNDSRRCRAAHGLCRTLVFNMVEGVSKGFEKRLELQGVGYRAQAKGKALTLNVGYSKPVDFDPPDGIDFAIIDNTGKAVNQGTFVIVSGIDKEAVGNTAAKIRDVRPPEVYKGKGIRYQGEIVRRKAGKSGKK
jgi:large subunit ribosomal protein L6